MNITKRALLYIFRRKTSSIILIIVIIVFLSFLVIGTSAVVSADAEIKRITDTLCNSFKIEPMVVQNDPSLWKDVVVDEEGHTQKAYIDPVCLDDAKAQEIMNVNGIIDYNAYTSNPGGYHTELDVKDAGWADGYYDMLFHPEHYDDTPDYDMDYMLAYFKRAMSCITLQADTKSENDMYFRNRSMELVQGRHILPDDDFKVLVSEDFADRNGIGVGDTVPIYLPQEDVDELAFGLDWQKPMNAELEVIGIFKINFRIEISPYTLEEELPENYFFVNIDTFNKIEKSRSIEPEKHPVLKFDWITFFVDDPKNIDNVISEMKEIEDISWSYIEITKDETDYSSIIKPLASIKNMGLFIMFGASAGCFIVICLFLTMRMRSRNKELGILLSLGIDKKDIMKQVLLESLIIGLIAFVISVILSGVLIRPFGNAMNDMFSSNENDERYTYSIDEYDRIITEPVASNVELDYDIGNCYIAALAGLAVYFIPVVSSSRRSLKKSLYEMLSE